MEAWRKTPKECPPGKPGQVHPCWGHFPCEKCKAKTKEWRNG